MAVAGAGRVLIGCAIGAIVLGGCTGGVDRTGGKPSVQPHVLHGINAMGSAELPFIEQVAALSKGSMQVDLEDGWHLMSPTGEAEAIQAVRSGKADFAVVPVRAWHGAGVTSFDALIAPMAVDSYQLQDAVLHDGMAAEMLTGVERLGLKGIAILPGPIREPAGITRDLLAPSGFAGARIAMSPGVVPDRSLRALGATPVASPFQHADVSGFDGVELQVGGIDGNNYDGVVTSWTGNVHLWPRPLVVVGSAKAVIALSAGQRAILANAAQAAISASTAELKRDEVASVRILCSRAKARIATASDTQVRQLRAAFGPVNRWLAGDPQTRRFLQRIQALRTKTAHGPATAPTCPASSVTAATGAVTPIDGVYEMTDTKKEALKFGLPDDGTINEQVGHFTWTCDRGVLSETQRNGTNFWFATYRYTVAGDALTMTVTDSGSSGPGVRFTKALVGDVYTWKWSLYRDQLTVRWIDPSAKKSDYPANYAVKPWTRVSDASLS